MKVLVHNPYGGLRSEVGTAYLLLNYLQELTGEVVQLQCDGAFSLCERDLEYPQGRDFHHCLRCMREQQNHAEWAGFKSRTISELLRPQDVTETRRWIVLQEPEEIWSATWYDLELQPLIHHSFYRFAGTPNPDFSSKHHSLLVQRLGLATIRLATAARRALNRLRPQAVAVIDGREYISRTLLECARQQNVHTVQMRSPGAGRFELIFNDGAPASFDLLAESVTKLRREVATWPKELLSTLDAMLDHLEISRGQLELPIAHNSSSENP